MHLSTRIKTVLYFLFWFCLWSKSIPVLAGCGDAYNFDSSRFVDGTLDICSIEDEIGDFEVLTNWGGRQEWISETQFVFVNTQVGNIYLMDLETNSVTNLTGNFNHAGFSRAHLLKNGDLLLVGPESGPELPEDPLLPYEVGRFDGSLWIFEAPFDQPPYLLKREVGFNFLFWSFSRMESVHAWEGVAVSSESDRIVWSDTTGPFEGENIFESSLRYIFVPSNLWSGEIVHQPGSSYLKSTQKILSKYNVGFSLVFLEPQNFLGHNDEDLTFNAYGPGASGTSDTYTYNFSTDQAKRLFTAGGYDEWEGASPNYEMAFVEVDRDRTVLAPSGNVELYLHNFVDQSTQRFSYFQDEYLRPDNFEVANAVFSPSGQQALFTTGGGVDGQEASHGTSIGIVLLRDVEAFIDAQP